MERDANPLSINKRGSHGRNDVSALGEEDGFNEQ